MAARRRSDYSEQHDVQACGRGRPGPRIERGWFCRGPCVTFNRKNTYDWYRERVYNLAETDHDPGDLATAFQKALERGDRIPLGVIYQTRRPTYGEQVGALRQGPIAARKLAKLTPAEVESLRAEFM